MLVYVFLGNVLRGIGETPIQPLGISYIDDYAESKNAALYIGEAHDWLVVLDCMIRCMLFVIFFVCFVFSKYNFTYNSVFLLIFIFVFVFFFLIVFFFVIIANVFLIFLS